MQQRTATHNKTLQSSLKRRHLTVCNVLQNVLQCTATHCNSLQRWRTLQQCGASAMVVSLSVVMRMTNVCQYTLTTRNMRDMCHFYERQDSFQYVK